MGANPVGVAVAVGVEVGVAMFEGSFARTNKCDQPYIPEELTARTAIGLGFVLSAGLMMLWNFEHIVNRASSSPDTPSCTQSGIGSDSAQNFRYEGRSGPSTEFISIGRSDKPGMRSLSTIMPLSHVEVGHLNKFKLVPSLSSSSHLIIIL